MLFVIKVDFFIPKFLVVNRLLVYVLGFISELCRISALLIVTLLITINSSSPHVCIENVAYNNCLCFSIYFFFAYKNNQNVHK